ncbi:MAG: D-Ala-D-Ala carboxypeptidase family metallohydrolase [Acidobacteria bacterium]|nr:D-Ala-D-Ala carboxypeptidase family metallohydrolase [Acidobacteriota bacterium]
MAGSSERLSTHFTLGEMIESGTARRDPELWRRQCAPPPEVGDAMRRLVINTLQPLRNLFGWPIVVNSGYRCTELNRRVGGASRSQHCRGEAADIRLAAGWTIDRGRDRLPLERVSEQAGGRPELLTPNGWLFTVAAVLIEQLEIDQLIHEYGDRFGAPAWIHISHGPRKRRKLLAIGDWTGGVYRSYLSLADMAEGAER